jgi:hypothetical protein
MQVRMIIRLLILTLLVPSGVEVLQGQVIFPWDDLPPALREAFGESPLAEVYDASDRINPLYLRGDFDGDGKVDYAILIKRKSDGKLGFAVWLSSRENPIILGAGSRVEYGASLEDHLDFDSWRVSSPNRFDSSTSIEQPKGFRRDCIFVQKGEDASGIFFFKAGKFHWLQEGD